MLQKNPKGKITPPKKGNMSGRKGNVLRAVTRPRLREPRGEEAALSAEAIAARVGLGLLATGAAYAGVNWLASRHAKNKGDSDGQATETYTVESHQPEPRPESKHEDPLVPESAVNNQHPTELPAKREPERPAPDTPPAGSLGVVTKDKKRKKKKSRATETNVSVLTYNVIHSIRNTMSHPRCKASPTCLENVCGFIDENAKHCDFIGIQEFSNRETLRKHSKKLSGMKDSHVFHTGKLQEIGPITFYDSGKYQLDDEHSWLKFDFGGLWRGIQINFFKGKLCVINVHAGHGTNRAGKPNSLDTFGMYLEKHLRSKYVDGPDHYVKKLQEYDIIMMGDMNNSAEKFTSFTVRGIKRNLSGRTTDPTCCLDESTLWGRATKAWDHILCTEKLTGKREVHSGLTLHSDHYPVIATLRRESP